MCTHREEENFTEGGGGNEEVAQPHPPYLTDGALK